MNFHTKSIVSALLVIGSIVIGYFFVWPKWTEYNKAQSKLSAAEVAREKLKTAEIQLNSFLAEYRAHPNESNTINSALPLSEVEMHNILNNLDRIAQSSGLTLGSLSMDERPATDTLGAKPNSIQSIKMTLTLGGSYPAFQNFLLHLENNLRLIDLDSVNIRSGSEGALDFTFSLTTYYQQ